MTTPSEGVAGFDELAVRPGGQPPCYGALRFPASKRAPAKWACIGPGTDDTQMGALVLGLLKTWRMPQPRVIISVIGEEGHRELDRTMGAQQRLVFRRGLLRAARTTRAWIVTGGTAGGVMAMVGRMVMDDFEQDGEEVVCLGLAAWDRVELHEQMEAKAKGAVFSYDAGQHAPHRRCTTEASAFSPYLSPNLTARTAAPAAAYHQPSTTQQPLDPNHTHFLLVDNPGARGSELALRSRLEATLTNFGASASSADGARRLSVETPGVVLVVGGGLATLEATFEALSKKRPVIAITDSGGAAEHLGRAWELYQAADQAQQRSQALAGDAGVDSAHGTGLAATPVATTFGGAPSCDEAEASSPSAQIRRLLESDLRHEPTLLDAVPQVERGRYVACLAECIAVGQRLEGANRSAQLSFFRTSCDVEGASNDLDVLIEQAILSDCEKTMDAIHHAVIWGDPAIIEDQLQRSKESDPVGLAAAFESALQQAASITGCSSTADRVVQVLIQFHAEARHVAYEGSSCESSESSASK